MNTRHVILALLMILLLSSPCVPVFADGMMKNLLKDYADIGEDAYVREESQTCYIKPTLFGQEMMLTVNLASSMENALWIFPVPASPNMIKIGITDEAPSLQGVNVKDTAASIFGITEQMLKFSQLYPLIPLRIRRGGSSYSMGLFLKEYDNIGESSSVSITQSISQYGLTTELIKTKDTEALDQYLQSHGGDLTDDDRELFEDYIDSGYSFVVSFPSESEPEHRRVSISISFPTRRLYFPLKLTSVYDSYSIPVHIVVRGYATPRLYSKIQGLTDVEYYCRGVCTWEDNTEYGVKYTSIKIVSRASNYIEDLWIERSPPVRLLYYDVMAHHPEASLFISLLLVSVFSGLFTGILFFREKANFLEFFKLGAFNMFTILGLAFMLYWVEFIEIRGKTRWILTGKHGVDVSKFVFIALYFVVFMATSSFFMLLLKI